MSRKYEIIIYWSEASVSPARTGCMADGLIYATALARAEAVFEDSHCS